MPPTGVAACLLLLLLGPPAASLPLRTVDLVPRSAVLGATLVISGEDEGISYMVDRLKAYLLSRCSGDEGIEDFTFLDVEEITFGVLPRKEGGNDFALAAHLVDRGGPIRVKAGKHDITINIRDTETARTFKRQILVALLELFIERGSESSKTVASPSGDVDISIADSSYTFFGDIVLVGSSREVVRDCGRASARPEDRLSSSRPYRDIAERLSGMPSDLRVFVDNGGDDFKKYVSFCRAEWGPILLSMAEGVDYLGVSVDIVDADTLRARVVSHSPDVSKTAATKAVTAAHLPLFIAKYLGEKVKQKFSASQDGLYLTVEVEVVELSGYWERLFPRREGSSGG